MKLQFAIVMAAILVGSVATVNMAFLSDSEISANSVKSVAGMVGHITLTATDDEGNIIAYRQTDNTVVNSADECIATDIFGATAFGGCTDAAYTFVHIGTDTTDSFTETSTDLVSFTSQTGGAISATTAAAALSGASVTITADFTDVGATIGEAALRNGASNTSSNVLALQGFSGIALGATDDLTIEWTVTIDGT